MCPLYPFHLILLYLCLLLPLLFAVVEGAEEFSKWNITFMPKSVEQLEEYNTTQAQLHCYDCKMPADNGGPEKLLQVALISDDPHIASLEHERGIPIKEDGDGEDGDGDGGGGILIDLQESDYAANGSSSNYWSITFNVTGRFLGFTKVNAQIKDKNNNDEVLKATDETNRLPVSVKRRKTLKSKIFGYSVALLISLAYINMGCAMDLSKYTFVAFLVPLVT